MSLELETGSQQESFQLWNVVVSNTTITVKKLFGTKLLNLYELDGLQIWQLMLSTMHMVDTCLCVTQADYQCNAEGLGQWRASLTTGLNQLTAMSYHY